MNGRLYDPVVGRFFSPDPYVQAPDFTQNFNRYSYCLNNPLMYTDPSGEFIGSALTAMAGHVFGIGSTLYNYGKAIFTEGALDPTNKPENRKVAWQKADKSVNHTWKEVGKVSWNAVKIDVGVFLHIPIWETGQTLIGNLASHFRNMTGQIDDVTIKGGVTLVNKNSPYNTGKWGFTFGPYINSENIKVDDDIFRHEYGHTIQSRILGPLYVSKIAIPSGLSFWLGDSEYHDKSWYEVWASRLGAAPDHQNEFRKSGWDGVWYWPLVITLHIFPY